MEKRLAKVNKASLEIQERGILNFWIYVDYEDGLSQGIGGIALDKYSKEKEARVGTAYGCEFIRRILLLFNVNDFSEIKGKMLWVIGEGEGLSFTVKGIESLAVDGKKKKIVFDDLFEEFRNVQQGH